jgi:MFS family permease
VTLSVALLLGGIALSRTTRATVPGLAYGDEAELGNALLTLATVIAFSVVGAIVASRRPSNTIGWIFCGTGLVVGLATLAGGYAEYWLASGSGPRGLGETAAWFASWAWIPRLVVPTSFLLLLFPDGRPPSPRWRPVAWCAGLGISGFVVGYALEAGPLEDFPQIANPYGVDSSIVGVVGVAASFVVGGSMVASAVSLVIRLRRGGSEQRQQIKWLTYGGAVVVGTIFVAGFIAIWSAEVSIVVISLALLVLPVLTGIAIVRHRLYDIDVLINRTLVYGSLTGTLVAVYFGGVVGLQHVFRAATGQEYTLAVVASTLAIAALFSPLRRRMQALVDRRFYRRKYDAAKTLAAFNARLREETDLQALSGDLVGVAKKTVQPAHVSLWLRPDAEPEAKSAAIEQFGNK